MRLLLDTTPLRVSHDFRRLWIGQAVSFLGTTMTAAALPFQVYQQTKSSLAVGLLGVAQLGPLLVCSIIGGAFADSMWTMNRYMPRPASTPSITISVE